MCLQNTYIISSRNSTISNVNSPSLTTYPIVYALHTYDIHPCIPHLHPTRTLSLKFQTFLKVLLRNRSNSLDLQLINPLHRHIVIILHVNRSLLSFTFIVCIVLIIKVYCPEISDVNNGDGLESTLILPITLHFDPIFGFFVCK